MSCMKTTAQTLDEAMLAADQAEAAFDVAFDAALAVGYRTGLPALDEARETWRRAQAAVDAAWDAQRAIEAA